MAIIPYNFCYNCCKYEIQDSSVQVVDLKGKLVDTVEKVKMCAKCRVATYCSLECQKSDWKTHKTSCLDSGVRLSRTIMQKTLSLKLEKYVLNTEFYFQCFINIDLQKNFPAIDSLKNTYKLVGSKVFSRSKADLTKKVNEQYDVRKKEFLLNLQDLAEKNKENLLVEVKIRQRVSKSANDWSRPAGNYLFKLGVPKIKNNAFQTIMYSPVFISIVPSHLEKCFYCNSGFEGMEKYHLNVLNDLVREIELGKYLQNDKTLWTSDLSSFRAPIKKEELNFKDAKDLLAEIKQKITIHEQKIRAFEFRRLKLIANHICRRL